MGYKHPGSGTIATFFGIWRHFNEALHPRGADGRFVEKPDFYVPLDRKYGNYGTEKLGAKVRSWSDTEPWNNLEASIFTEQLKGFYDHPYTGDGPLLGTVRENPFSEFRLDPSLPEGMYAYGAGEGKFSVSPSFFNLTPDERRHVLYAAAFGHGGDISPEERHSVFGPGANYGDLFGGAFIPNDAVVQMVSHPIPESMTGSRFAEDTVDVDFRHVLQRADFSNAGDTAAVDRIEAMTASFYEDGVTPYLLADRDGKIVTPNADETLAAILAGPGQFDWLTDPRFYEDGKAGYPVRVLREVDDPIARPTDLHGKTHQADVFAEAYATLADNDAMWLDDTFPGLAPIVRREAIAMGLPIDAGVVAPPNPNDTRFAYGVEAEVPPKPDYDYTLSYDENRDAAEAWKADALSLAIDGKLSPADAEAIFILPCEREKWSPLPPKLWHVTTATDKVIADGFKTRRQLDMQEGLGLGAGPDDLISFTDDETLAGGIYSALLEARAVASGDLTLADLIQMDVDGKWAYIERGSSLGLPPGGITKAMLGVSFGGRVADAWNPGDPLPPEVLARWEGGPNDHVWDDYRAFIMIRDSSAHGPIDPLFMSTDWKGLGKLDPADFAILEVEPDSTQYGWRMGDGLGEWRLYPQATPTEIIDAKRPIVDDKTILPSKTLHRGLDFGSMPEDDIRAIGADPATWVANSGLLSGALGEHWSRNPDAAFDYARGLAPGSGVSSRVAVEREGDPFRVGIVVTAEVRPSSIQEYGTWTDKTSGRSMRLAPSADEAEDFIPEGSDVSVLGVKIVVTDRDSGDYTEEYVSLDALEAAMGTQLGAVSAVRADFASRLGQHLTDPSWRNLQISANSANPTPEEAAAIRILEGMSPNDNFGLMFASNPRNVADSLRIVQGQTAQVLSAETLGFSVPDTLRVGDAESKIHPDEVVATLLANQPALSVGPDGVTWTLPDGTVLRHDGMSSAIASAKGAGLPGDYGRLLASKLIPQAFTSEGGRNGAAWGIQSENDTWILTAAIGNAFTPEAPSINGIVQATFRYDPQSRHPVGYTMSDRQEVHEAFQDIAIDRAHGQRAEDRYTSLIDRFGSVPGFNDILPMPSDDTSGANAYTTPAGTGYFQSADFTDQAEQLRLTYDSVVDGTIEGLVTHEFGHRLFAAQVTSPQGVRAAQVALEAARHAVEAEWDKRSWDTVRPHSVLEEASKLSYYAGTSPPEAYAELFTAYIMNDPNETPSWVQTWGRAFEAAYRDATAHPDYSIPVTTQSEILRAGLFRPVVAGPTYSEATLLPRELAGQMRSQYDEMGELDGDLNYEFAEHFTQVFEGGALGYDRIYFDTDYDGQVRAWVPGPDGEDTQLFTLGTGEVVFDGDTPSRELLDFSARLAIEYASVRGDATRAYVAFLGGPSGIPPLSGPDEIKSFMVANRSRVENHMRAIDHADDISVANIIDSAVFTDLGTITESTTLAEYLDAHAEFRDALLADTKRSPFLAYGSLLVNSDYLGSRREAINSQGETALASIGFHPRDKTLAELRKDKLTKVYGEDFAERVREEVAAMEHPRVADFGLIARDEDTDTYEVYDNYRDAILEHFANFSHSYEDADGIERTAIFELSSENMYSDSLELKFNVIDVESGDYLGECARSFNFDDDPPYVYHDLLALNDEAQGYGIGYAWNRHNDAWYVANGFTQIKVHAALSEGGYAWLSDFFIPDYDDETKRVYDDIKMKAESVLTSGSSSDEELISALQVMKDAQDGGGWQNLDPWEIVHMGYHDVVAKDRSWIGHTATSGKSWHGTKDLDALMREAGVDMGSIEGVRSGFASKRDSYAPYWRYYRHFDPMEIDASDWIRNGIQSLPDDIRPQTTDSSELAIEFASGATAYIPSGGGKTRNLYIGAMELDVNEAAATFVAALGAMESRDPISEIVLQHPDAKAVLIEAEKIRQSMVGPNNRAKVALWASPDLNVVHAVEAGQDPEIDQGGIDFSRDQSLTAYTDPASRFDSLHLGHPDMGSVPAMEAEWDQSGTSRIWSTEDGTAQFIVGSLNIASDFSFGEDSTLTDDEKRSVTLNAWQTAPRATLFHGEAAEMARFQATSNGDGGLGSWLITLPDGTHDFGRMSSVNSGMAQNLVKVGCPPWNASLGDLDMVRRSFADWTWRLTETINQATDGTFSVSYAPGRALLSEDPGGDPPSDHLAVNALTEVLTSRIEWGASVIGLGDKGWTTISIDVGNADVAAQIASPEALSDIYRRSYLSPADGFVTVDGSVITIDVTKGRVPTPSWFTPLTVDTDFTSVSGQKVASSFFQWTQATEPNEPLHAGEGTAYDLNTAEIRNNHPGNEFYIPLDPNWEYHSPQVAEKETISMAEQVSRFTAAFNLAASQGRTTRDEVTRPGDHEGADRISHTAIQVPEGIAEAVVGKLKEMGLEAGLQIRSDTVEGTRWMFVRPPTQVWMDSYVGA